MLSNFWLWYFRRGFLTPSKKRSPLTGHLDSKRWVDTYTTKTGKSQYNENDSTWDDDDKDGKENIWND